MKTTCSILALVLAVLSTACDAEPVSGAGDLEDVVVTIDEICGDTAVRPSAPDLERDPIVEPAPAPIALEGLDPLEAEAAPSFCGGAEISGRVEIGGITTAGALPVEPAVCTCDSPGCVAEVVSESFGCGACVTFECRHHDRRACVPCDQLD